MKGRRLPDITQDAEGWSPIPQGVQGGDYWKLIKNNGEVVWYCIPPHPGLPIGGLSLHEIEEHEDGTITVSPSILMTGQHEWHGYLRAGVWSEV